MVANGKSPTTNAVLATAPHRRLLRVLAMPIPPGGRHTRSPAVLGGTTGLHGKTSGVGPLRPHEVRVLCVIDRAVPAAWAEPNRSNRARLAFVTTSCHPERPAPSPALDPLLG